MRYFCAPLCPALIQWVHTAAAWIWPSLTSRLGTGTTFLLPRNIIAIEYLSTTYQLLRLFNINDGGKEGATMCAETEVPRENHKGPRPLVTSAMQIAVYSHFSTAWRMSPSLSDLCTARWIINASWTQLQDNMKSDVMARFPFPEQTPAAQRFLFFHKIKKKPTTREILLAAGQISSKCRVIIPNTAKFRYIYWAKERFYTEPMNVFLQK